MIIITIYLCVCKYMYLFVQVAELRENGEVVGMVRGCIKRVGTNKSGDTYFNLGSISGLRVSPSHRSLFNPTIYSKANFFSRVSQQK